MNSTETFVPCSAKHKGCTKAHSELVWGYRVERKRQEMALEELTGNYPGDIAHHFATGGKRLITFKEWLVAHKRVDKIVVPAEVIEIMAPLAARAVAAIEAEEAAHRARWELDTVVGW